MPDPRSDRVFKRIFHNHPQSLTHLLNTFLPLRDPIEAVEYMPEELQSDLSGMHLSIVDVRCRDTNGRHFIVEMQLQKKPMFFRRVLMNACRIYTRQGSLAEGLAEVCPVYTLCLLDHQMFPDDPSWVHHIESRASGPSLPSFGELHFTFVEIRKWMKLGTFDTEDTRDLWMLFFTKPDTMKEIFTPEQRLRYAEMWQAVREWDLTKHSERELWIMDKKVQDMWTHQSYVKIYREEGRQEGLEEGRQEGFQKGFESLLGAYRHLLDHPETTDEELAVRFQLSAEMVTQVRGMSSGFL